VLVTAGSTPAANAASASAELYDPDSKTWSKATSMGKPRYYHTSTPLLDGTVLVAGGTSGPTGNMLPAVTTAEIYDASVDKWTPAGTLVPAVSEHAATLLNDGSVLVTGGFDGSVAINGAQVYCPP
jgi:N-acetylneuraminic acid mutarotase